MFFQNSFEQNNEMLQDQQWTWPEPNLQSLNAEFFGKWVVVALFVIVGFIVWPRDQKNKFNRKSKFNR